MVRLYGIPNCDTMKHARRWLDAHGVEYAFHDFKRQGLEEALLRAWIEELGWETLLNRRGQTWRRLSPAVREGMNETLALQVMLENPSIIRRPVLDSGARRHVGFSETDYAEIFA